MGVGTPVTPRLRVVYLDHAAAMSGAEIALLNLLSCLDGVDAHVILAEDGPLVAALEERGIAVEVLAMPARTARLRKGRIRPGSVPMFALWDTGGYVWRLRSRLRALRPDVVHTNSLKAGLYGSLASRLAGLPVIWHVRDRVARDYLPRAAVFLVRRALAWLPTAVVANSQTTLATLPSTNARSVIASPVIYDPVAHPGRVERGDGDVVVFGMVGRLAPWKGQHLFLEAFASAFSERTNVRARVVGGALFGEDAYAASLVRLAERLAVSDRVVFTGFRDDVFAEMAQMDVLVHCSTIPEPFGQVVTEGMATGLAVIAPSVGGPAEIITPDVNGLLVPISDVPALAAAMRFLVDRPDERLRLGDAARLACETYRPERIAEQVYAAYSEVLRKHRR